MYRIAKENNYENKEIIKVLSIYLSAQKVEKVTFTTWLKKGRHGEDEYGNAR